MMSASSRHNKNALLDEGPLQVEDFRPHYEQEEILVVDNDP